MLKVYTKEETSESIPKRKDSRCHKRKACR